ncbi:type I glyceraldehyde-3-phosphate dehydrogenase [soil metagenome]
MTIKVAINGYGRIGRNILRALYESKHASKKHEAIKIVAINNMGNAETDAYMTRYDSTHGRFAFDVSVEGEYIIINGDAIRVTSERDPTNLPWKELDIDVVYECTGHFTSKEAAMAHIRAGAKKVIISAPAQNADATIVYGVNHQQLKASDQIISNASCTTNCLAPIVKPLHDKIGIVSGLMVTIHSYTNDQALLDTAHGDVRRGRAAALSMIPSKTGAAAAIGLVIPELNGKLDGYAVRVPTPNVSVVDFTFESKRPTTVAEVDQILKDASNKELKGILAYNTEPLVSIDFDHNPASSIFDATQTKVLGNLVKVVSWYDNEWGFSNRMLDVTLAAVK